MNIGRMRHRVILQRQATTQTLRGAQVFSWSDVAMVWAEVRSPSARERVAGDLEVAQATHLVVMRRRADTTSVNRVLWGTRVLSVLGVLDVDNRGRFQTLECVELIGDGEVR